MKEFACAIVQQLSVDLSNEPGALAKISEALAGVGVLIHGISVDSGHSVSRVNFVYDRPEKALGTLRALGENVSAKDIVSVVIHERRVGQMTRITRALADASINIDTIYLTSMPGQTQACVYISSSNSSAEAVRDKIESLNQNA